MSVIITMNMVGFIFLGARNASNSALERVRVGEAHPVVPHEHVRVYPNGVIDNTAFVHGHYK